ncbi:GNAT family N-acetyltransferase [Methylobrevis pamukkalensis]|uniref:Acetyltransferase (GNAT) family protein n=1 Tax=Methylobrevis pamukkalensis TaxID=1439726 RepID=A0A1E3GY61_9HYPH|nr:N-acetyltransferase [Methylobrevis pamukkalensis]ODN68998.1 Acetyltransferase (GNAT) family protein [Methylobrevis pamukkalensis]
MFQVVSSRAPAASDLVITDETAFDVAARDALLDASFGPARFAKSSERIRAGRLPAQGLALTAKLEDRLVGTVRLWNIAAGDAGAALLLGPLAADPQIRGAGIGTALMRHALLRARLLGHRAVILVGDPEYYVRFGFSAAHTAGLAMPGPFEAHRLLAAEFAPGCVERARGEITPTGRPVPMPADRLALAA